MAAGGGSHNMGNGAIKRIMSEAKELAADASDEVVAVAMEDDVFDWHFTIRGPDETAFAGGIYHGRILLPPDYPHKPPQFMFMTPNGRFEVGKKICLSISQHHPEHWQPSWGIRTSLIALRGFMPSKGEGAIGSLDYTVEERIQLAAASRKWRCERCGDLHIRKLLDAEWKPYVPPPPATSAAAAARTQSAPAEMTSAPAPPAAAASVHAVPEQGDGAAPTLPTITPAPTPAAAPAAPLAPAVVAAAAPAPVTQPQPAPHPPQPQPQQPQQQQVAAAAAAGATATTGPKDDAGLTAVAFAIVVAILGLVLRRVIMHWDVITGM